MDGNFMNDLWIFVGMLVVAAFLLGAGLVGLIVWLM